MNILGRMRRVSSQESPKRPDFLESAIEDFGRATVLRLATDVLAGKLKEQGLSLSRRQRRKLESFVASMSDSSHLTFGTWRFWERRREIKIEITQHDVAEVERRFETHADAAKAVLPEIVRETAASIVKRLNRAWPAYRRLAHKQKTGFSQRLARQWSPALSELEELIVICRDIGQEINAFEREENSLNRPFTVEVVTRLHARACQVALEILTLLESGFADGAFARWRTLHEIAMILLFVSKHGEPVAKGYCQWQTVQSYFAARQHREYEERSKLAPIPDDDFRRVEEDYNALVEREGPLFKEDFGWAMIAFPGKKKLTLQNIEKDIDVQQMRPYLRSASYNVHAHPLGTFYPLGVRDGSRILLAGPSTFGLAEAGQNTALSLATATCGVLELTEMNTDIAVYLNVIHRVSDSVARAFVKVEGEMRDSQRERAKRDEK